MNNDKIGYKIFDSDLKCRGKQYVLNETNTQNGEIKVCENGIHICETPFDCLGYYGFIGNDLKLNRFAKVKGFGAFDCVKDKIAVSNMDIIEELKLSDFIDNEIELIQKDINNINDDNSAKIGSSGYSAQIGSSGDSAQIGSSGDSAQIGSSGDSAQIGSSGYSAQIGSSGDSAQIGSSGDYAQIGSSGDSAQIGSSGDYAQIGSSGKNCVICCAGSDCKVKAMIGSWITLAEWVDGIPVKVVTKKVDGIKIKENVYYTLKNGRFKECSDET